MFWLDRIYEVPGFYDKRVNSIRPSLKVHAYRKSSTQKAGGDKASPSCKPLKWRVQMMVANGVRRGGKESTQDRGGLILETSKKLGEAPPGVTREVIA